MSDIDPETGLPFVDRGTAQDAIDFLIDCEHLLVPDQATIFLRRWRDGNLGDYHEFYVWLKARS